MEDDLKIEKIEYINNQGIKWRQLPMEDKLKQTMTNSQMFSKY